MKRRSLLQLGLVALAVPARASKKRWAMVIDERKCASHPDCKACAQACHRAHNVPALRDARHEVKWIWKEPFENVFPDRVNAWSPPATRERPTLVMCNHCENPPCVRVCPTQATWKRGDGIVMMDQHRCIGCRYCIAACPYGARSFNFEDPAPALAERTDYPTRTRGVVEKCTFCAERIADGAKPLCVEACAAVGCNALTFGDAADPSSEVSALLRSTDVARRHPELGTSPNVFYVL